jgi:hypothetical protein
MKLVNKVGSYEPVGVKLLTWDPTSRGNTYHVLLFLIAHRHGPYSDVLSEGVDATIPVTSTYKWTKIPHLWVDRLWVN